jgi:glycosyltransferase involved in cell wall biosynthesis
VEGRLLRRAERVVVLSRYTAGLAADRYGVEPARIAVIPPGVDLDRFQPGDRSAARARLGIADGVAVAVTVRRLVRRTGVDLLLEAWRRAPGPDGAVLLIAGTGVEGDRLRAEAAGMDSVRFLGAVDDAELADLYRAADVSVVPSRSLEGFGLVVLESLACGTPVVGTTVGGLPEVLADRPGCLAVEPTAEALAEGLALALAAQPDRAAARAAVESCDWATAASAHAALYRQLGATR